MSISPVPLSPIDMLLVVEMDAPSTVSVASASSVSHSPPPVSVASMSNSTASPEPGAVVAGSWLAVTSFQLFGSDQLWPSPAPVHVN
jgi:hypothetical protein